VSFKIFLREILRSIIDFGCHHLSEFGVGKVGKGG